MHWKQMPTLKILELMSKNTLLETLGVEWAEIGEDFIRARMPVDARHVQPARLLHGGVSVMLAETLGSVASVFCLEPGSSRMPVGLEINANHLRPVHEGGSIVGEVRALRIGRNVHVWSIQIFDESNQALVCVSRLTVAIVDQPLDGPPVLKT